MGKEEIGRVREKEEKGEGSDGEGVRGEGKGGDEMMVDL